MFNQIIDEIDCSFLYEWKIIFNQILNNDHDNIAHIIIEKILLIRLEHMYVIIAMNQEYETYHNNCKIDLVAVKQMNMIDQSDDTRE